MIDADPWDYYEEYSEWLMENFPERAHNGDSLLALFEDAVGFDEFMEERHAGILRDSTERGRME
jgi:hypothetical protein